MQETKLTRKNVSSALLLILCGSLGIQCSSALSSSLFSSLNPLSVSSLRMMIAAIIFCIIFRPRIIGRSKQQWRAIIIYGIAMAAMNGFLYLAISKLSLGIAVTIDFLGPCVVALLGCRRWREVAFALLGLMGVILIAGPGGDFNIIGYACGLGAAISFGLYTYAAERVGKTEDTMQSLALSILIAALITSPLSISVSSSVTGNQWRILLLSAIIGVTLPYSVDTIAAKITTARVVGTLFALDPVVASSVGAIFLHEYLNFLTITGIFLVAIAGVLIMWFSEK